MDSVFKNFKYCPLIVDTFNQTYSNLGEVRIQLQNFTPRHNCLTSAAEACQAIWQHCSFRTQWASSLVGGNPYYSLVVISKPVFGGSTQSGNKNAFYETPP